MADPKQQTGSKIGAEHYPWTYFVLLMLITSCTSDGTQVQPTTFVKNWSSLTSAEKCKVMGVTPDIYGYNGCIGMWSKPQTTSNKDDRTGEVAMHPSGIKLRERQGAFLVPVSINNALTLDFFIDSGAADVSIPADVVLTLFRTGTLSQADFIGTTTYQLADGSAIPSKTFLIRTLKVGDREVSNVQGSVSGVQGSLLLGQSFLMRFKSWSIDNERHILTLE